MIDREYKIRLRKPSNIIDRSLKMIGKRNPFSSAPEIKNLLGAENGQNNSVSRIKRRLRKVGLPERKQTKNLSYLLRIRGVMERRNRNRNYRISDTKIYP